MSKKVTHDMTVGNPTNLILKFALPMLIGNLFQQLYNMVDSIIVGRYEGANALAAVGATGPLNFLIFSLALGLSSGISIVIAQYFGAKDEENVKKTFVTGTYLIIGASLFMGIVGFIFSKPILSLLNTPDTIIGNSDIYMKITCLGIIGIGIYNGIASVLRAMGDSITPLIFLAVACVLNILLDLLFVVVYHKGVAGVAIATIISQIIAAISCTIYALYRLEILRIPLKDFKIDPVLLKKCIKLGLPVAFQNSFVALSVILLQNVINGYGEVIIAASTAANRIEQLILQPCTSVGAAVAFYTGQNIGGMKIDRVKKGFVSASKIIIIFGIIMLPVMYFGGEYIMMMFTKKEDIEVVRVGVNALRITSFFYTFVGMIFISRNLLSGAGDVNVSMLMGLTEVICRVLFASILSKRIGYSGIWWATGLTWMFTSFVGIIRYYSGRWKYKSVVHN